MVCSKCGYKEKKELIIYGKPLCKVCATFSPKEKGKFESYILESVDWKVIDTFRNKGEMPGFKKKAGMTSKAKRGGVVTRTPFGYTSVKGILKINEDAIRLRSLFKTFLDKDYSLNQLSKLYGFSVNGLKKILKNRTYLGEIKFDGQFHKAYHESIISPEVFYAVQRKLENYLRPRKNEANRYKDLKGEVEPLKKEIIQRVDTIDNQKDYASSRLYNPLFDE